MGPHFVERFDLAELYKLCTFTDKYKSLIRIHPSALLHRKVYVHWMLETKRSTACSGPGCPHCETIGREPRCYAPGLEWHNKQQQWVKRVVPINAGCLAVLDTDLANLCYECDRAYGARNAPVRMREKRMNFAVPAVPDFDITPTLLRIWGVQTKVE